MLNNYDSNYTFIYQYILTTDQTSFSIVPIWVTIILKPTVLNFKSEYLQFVQISKESIQTDEIYP